MKTHDLIAALAQDRELAPPPTRVAAWALPLGAVVAAAVLLLSAGPRADLAQVAGSARFLFKLLVTLSLAACALGLFLRMATPLPRAARWARALWLAPALLLLGVAMELALLPGADWLPAARGRNALWCLAMVPMLAIAPLLACLYCLRQAAPASPARAGAVAGLLSGAIAAAIYALHCTDDSPLFVALWYTVAVAGVTAIGAWAGDRVARW